MSTLGFGLMRLPQRDGVIDVEETARMADRFLAAGFTYFDTAWMYCGFQSENAARGHWSAAIPGTALRWPPNCTPGF